VALFRSLKGMRDLINSSKPQREEGSDPATFCDDLVTKSLDVADDSSNHRKTELGVVPPIPPESTE
jgi:hypothetical protein